MTNALHAVLESGDHVCSVYQTPKQHYAVAVPFIRFGLDRGEKCFYVPDAGATAAAREALEADGIDTERAISRGALVFSSDASPYLTDGAFDLYSTIGFWREITAQAKREGFSAMRISGETAWVARGAPGLERWLDYEAELSRATHNEGWFVLCQYNRELFPARLILGVMSAHPVVIYGSAIYPDGIHLAPSDPLFAGSADLIAPRFASQVQGDEEMRHAVQDFRKELERRRVELRNKTLDLQRLIYEEAVRDKSNAAAPPVPRRAGDNLSELAGRLLSGYATLNPEERAVMSNIAQGLLSKKVAALLDMSEGTVKLHRHNVMRKMEASSFAELVLMSAWLNATAGSAQKGDEQS